MSRFEKLSHVIWHCQYHIIWVPKYRFRVLKGEIAREVHIPAHREHSFWFNVNTYSGRT